MVRHTAIDTHAYGLTAQQVFPESTSKLITGTTNVVTLPPFFGGGANDKEPTAQAAALVLLGQASTIFNVHIMGFGTLSPWETIANRPDNATFDSVNWWSQDMYVNEVGGGASQTKMLTLALAPDWMKTGGVDGTTTYTDPLYTDNPSAGHVADFAELCAIACTRFSPTRVQVWNEGKGMSSTAEYNTLFNAVYPAVKAVKPATLIGGPYFVVHTITAGQDPSNESSELTGAWGSADQRDLDSLRSFLTNCSTDYLVVDGGNWRTDLGAGESHAIGAGRLCDFIADFMTWFRALGSFGWASGNNPTTMDVGWAEFYLWPKYWGDYYSSPSPENETTAVMLRGWMTAVAAGFKYALHWEPEGDDDGQAEPLGLFASTRNGNSTSRGAVTLFHAALKELHDRFPPGTPIYATHNTNVNVYCLANATHILSVNTQNSTQATVAIPGITQISHTAWEWKVTAWVPA